MAENSWYVDLRAEWKPRRVRILLIGESAPDDDGDISKRRFFYAPTLTMYDNLYRGVVGALFDEPLLSAGDTKSPWLTRLKDQGIFLIDLVDSPVNNLPVGRAARRRASVDACVERAVGLNPDGIIICHAPSFKLLRGPLLENGLRLLHDEPIPFPLGSHRASFIARFSKAAGSLTAQDS